MNKQYAPGDPDSDESTNLRREGDIDLIPTLNHIFGEENVIVLGDDDSEDSDEDSDDDDEDSDDEDSDDDTDSDEDE